MRQSRDSLAAVRIFLEPTVEWFRDGIRPVVENNAKHFGVGYGQAFLDATRRVPPRSVCFQNQHDAIGPLDRKSTRLNPSHGYISYAVFCLKKKNIRTNRNNLISGVDRFIPHNAMNKTTITSNNSQTIKI